MDAADSLQVIVGAGPVGTALAVRLSREGKRVRVLTRSGRDTGIADVEFVATDASDPEQLTAATSGAQVLYNCANPGAYQAWEREWPPLAAAFLTAAERTGAVLVTASNLYGYGPVSEPMNRSTPLRPSDHKGALRTRMWHDALAAHEAGRVRVAEARASDYIGPTLPVGNGLLAMYADATLAGSTARVFADPDQPHTWTAIEDVAATLSALGQNEKAWGSAWIVPSNPPQTVRQVLQALHTEIGLAEPRLQRIPRWVLRTASPFVPLVREVVGVLYQFDAPFVSDGSETTERLGVPPTAWTDVVSETAAAWHTRARGEGRAGA
ncbi:NAD-dependent epimerase/dehydratase family protein [Microbacterium betulae]|uniref:NAD-dependent epimerase/dehydratase family protein n=1 Tax=Microbacterium betulae TaxID=2981139 RepID=A0AA97FGM1_9MICO|nr:NAD-dependent epimerase/dehydratase family protein [Microbacterium sp. AB]WOF21905.1 NAD-dependent epimerase/dehydratase family protein [Microbacterium sp. AB]